MCSGKFHFFFHTISLKPLFIIYTISIAEAVKMIPIWHANFWSSLNWASENSRYCLCSPYVLPQELGPTYGRLRAAELNFSCRHVFWNLTQSAPLSYNKQRYGLLSPVVAWCCNTDDQSRHLPLYLIQVSWKTPLFTMQWTVAEDSLFYIIISNYIFLLLYKDMNKKVQYWSSDTFVIFCIQ